MWKALRIAVLFMTATTVLMGAVDEPDIFANATAISVARRANSFSPQATGAYTGDEFGGPKSVFHAGEFVCWWTTGIVTPKGTGLVDEVIVVDATTPRRTRTFQPDGPFQICNTSNPAICDDIPDFTTWNLGVCVQIPGFVDRLLQRVGSVPFDSVVTGSGYENFVFRLSGSSAAPLP